MACLLLTVQHQAVIWASYGLSELLGSKLSEIWIKIQQFSYSEINLKMLSAKMAAILSRPHCAYLGADSVQMSFYQCSNSHKKVPWPSAEGMPVRVRWQLYINPLRAKFWRGNINVYLHFKSLLHIDLTQVLKILPQVRPGPTYST